MSTVYIKKTSYDNIDSALSFCLKELLTPSFLKNVRNVLIKPNFVNSFSSETGVTVDLNVIEALIAFLKSLGIANITVGESSLFNTESVFTALNVWKYKKRGVNVVNFDQDVWIKVKSPIPLVIKELSIAKSVFDADLIISLAKMKTHQSTQVTLSVKNLFGCIHPKNRKIAHITDLDQGISEIFAYIVKNKKAIGVMDGMVGLEGRLGPTIGNPVKLDLIVSSDDLLSLDSVCAEIMGTDYKKVRHLKLCSELKLNATYEYRTVGEPVASVRTPFVLPTYWTFLFTHFPLLQQKHLNRLFQRKPYLRYPDKCTRCMRCARSCPLECISPEGNHIKFNRDKCISCFVCLEACMQGALDYKVHRYSKIYSIFKAMRNIAARLIGVFRTKT